MIEKGEAPKQKGIQVRLITAQERECLREAMFDYRRT